MARMRNTNAGQKKPPSTSTSTSANHVTSEMVIRYSIPRRKPTVPKKTNPPKKPVRTASPEDQEKVTWIINKAKHPTAIFQGFVYTFQKFLANEKVAYRCKFRDKHRLHGNSCPGKIDIDMETLNVTGAVQHSHALSGPKTSQRKIRTKNETEFSSRENFPKDDQSPNQPVLVEQESSESQYAPPFHYFEPANTPVYNYTRTSPRIVNSIPTLEEVRNGILNDEEEEESGLDLSISNDRDGPRTRSRKNRRSSEESSGKSPSLITPETLSSRSTISEKLSSRPRTRSSEQKRLSQNPTSSTNKNENDSIRENSTEIEIPFIPTVSQRTNEVEKKKKKLDFSKIMTITPTSPQKTTPAKKSKKQKSGVNSLAALHAETIKHLSPPHSWNDFPSNPDPVRAIPEEENSVPTTEIQDEINNEANETRQEEVFTDLVESLPAIDLPPKTPTETVEAPSTPAPVAVAEDLTWVLTGRKQKHPPVIALEHIYNFHRQLPGSRHQVYRCISRQTGPPSNVLCPGELIISSCRRNVVEQQAHSHQPNRDLSQRLMNTHIVRSRLYNHVTDSPLPIRKAYNEFRKKKIGGEEHLMELLPEWKDVKKILVKLRNGKAKNAPEVAPSITAVVEKTTEVEISQESTELSGNPTAVSDVASTETIDPPDQSIPIAINNKTSENFLEIPADPPVSGLVNHLMEPEVRSQSSSSLAGVCQSANSLAGVSEIFRQMVAITPLGSLQEFASPSSSSPSLSSSLSPTHNRLPESCWNCSRRLQVALQDRASGNDESVPQMTDAATDPEVMRTSGEKCPNSDAFLSIPLICNELENTVRKLLLQLETGMATAGIGDQALATACVSALASKAQIFLDNQSPKPFVREDVLSPMYVVEFDMDP